MGDRIAADSAVIGQTLSSTSQPSIEKKRIALTIPLDGSDMASTWVAKP